MTGAKKNRASRLAGLLGAAILTIAAFSISSFRPGATVASPIEGPVLSADGSMPPPAPLPLPKPGTKRS